MQLIKVDIHGYKRFRDKTSMYLRGKTISILGANEAGKSSFLNALVHFNHDDEFSESGGKFELSRDDPDIPDDQKIITWHFILKDSDHNELEDIPEAKNIKKYISSKFKNGNYENIIEPNITKDISSRKELERIFLKINQKYIERYNQYIENFTSEDKILKVQNFEQTIEIISSQEIDLNEEEISLLEDASFVVSKIKKNKDPKYIKGLEQSFENVIENEKREDPNEAIIEILKKLEPRFLLFDEDARNLKEEYNLEDENDMESKALKNLCQTADIDTDKLKSYIDNGDSGQVRTLINSGNKKIKDKFEAWNQSSVYPEIENDNYLLKIFTGEQNGDNTVFDMINERSDGLRQFFALFTFIHSVDNESKILLIDEAEIHLHYDAQADFIQMLTNQTLADKVIYTTHSVGCLPEDLGMSVRLIEQDSEKKKSKVINWFWDNERQGFSPILFGMGASTLAFMPLRNAIVVEGATDHILLPTLIKEAIEKETLGFQIVPGLSKIAGEQISIMDNESPTTLFLLDSDHEEELLRKKLKDAKINEDRIFSLPKNKLGKGISLEDLIDKNIFLEVINSEIQKYSEKGKISLKDIPDFNRMNVIENLCNTKGYAKVQKRELAIGILEQKAEGKNVLCSEYIYSMKELHTNILGKFN